MWWILLGFGGLSIRVRVEVGRFSGVLAIMGHCSGAHKTANHQPLRPLPGSVNRGPAWHSKASPNPEALLGGGTFENLCMSGGVEMSCEQ